MSNYLFKLSQQVPECTCLYGDCDKTVYAYYPASYRVKKSRDDSPDWLIDHDSGWTEAADGCWYCPEHPAIDDKGWIYEGSEVRVEYEGEQVYGEVIEFTQESVTVSLNGAEGNVLVCDPDEVSA